MAHQTRKPLKDKSFYLDLRFYRNHEELIRNLKKLGAKLESFLSRDVDYVVTDKEDLKPKLETWTPATPKSFMFSPSSSMSRHDLNLSPFDTPSNTSSTANESKTPILSRGLALVQKAKQVNKGTTDLLEVCNQWNIKVLHIQKMLGYIAKCNIYTPKKSNENRPPQKNYPSSGSFRKLVPPVIKVEDSRCKYKPHYKGFGSLKEIVDKQLHHVVYSLQSEVLKPNVLTPLNVGQLSNVLVSSTMKKSSPSLNFAPPMQKTLLDTKLSKPSDKKHSNKVTEHLKVKNAIHSQRQLAQKKKNSLKKKYCEICCCSFTSIYEHLKNDKHSRFMQDKRNFKAVERVISQLPKVSDFLQNDVSSIPEDSSSNYSLPNVIDFTVPRKSPNAATQEFSIVKGNIAKARNDNLKDKLDLEEEIVDASCPSDYSPVKFPFLDGVSICEVFQNLYSDEIKYSVPACMDSNNKTFAESYGVVSYTGLTALPLAYSSARQAACEENQLWKNAVPYMDCIGDQELLATASRFSNPAQNNVDCSTHLDYSIKDKTYCSNFSESEHVVTPFLPNNVSAELKCDETENLLSVKSSVATPCNVIRKFPFTNFGFGWNASFTPEPLLTNAYENNPLHEGCSTAFNSSEDVSDSTGSWKELNSNVSNLCKSFVDNYDDADSQYALDLTVEKPCFRSTASNLLLNDVETAVLVAM